MIDWDIVASPITTYGQGVRFANAIFNLFNGKVNPTFPAKLMLFSPVLEENILGYSFGDVISIDIHEVMKDCCPAPAVLKGKILDTVIHELFHIGQDVPFYYSLSSSTEEVHTLIEASCRAATSNWIWQLKASGIRDSFGRHIDLGIAPQPQIDGMYDLEEMFQQALYSYYPVKDSLDKAVYYFNLMIMRSKDPSDNLYNYTSYPNVAVEVWINKRLVSQGLVRHNGIWLPTAMMDTIRPAVVYLIMSRRTSTLFCQQIDINTDASETVHIVSTFETEDPLFYIAYQLPSDEKPIPPIV